MEKRGPYEEERKTPEYKAWYNMKSRCNNPNHSDYRHYGARGITYTPKWEGYDNFLADMGRRPDGLTLERKEVDGDYTPDNCCWASPTDQARNRRFIKRRRGKTNWEWAETLGIKLTSFRMRLWRYRRGEITEEQLFAPSRRARQ